jgi:hypothetical protein
MNLVTIAKWIQEGYRKYYYIKKTEGISSSSHDFVLRHVMNLGRGQLNPMTIDHLIDLETSVREENGIVQC